MTRTVEAVSPLDLDLVNDAVDVLLDGGVVVLPTDTVYGVGASVELQSSIDRIFNMKKRPRASALPVLVGSIDQARRLSRLTPLGERLATRHWPGPLTLIVDRRSGFDADLGGDSTTVGIRIPDSELVRSLCEGAGPLAVTSANISGEPESRSVEEARAAFGTDADLYIDGGRSKSALASTVVDVRGRARVLRVGVLDPGELGIPES